MFDINTDFFVSPKTHKTHFVLINLLVYRIFSGFPSLFFRHAANSAFISAALSGFFAFAAIFLLARLYSKKKASSLPDSNLLSFGRVGRYIIFVLATICLFFSAVAALNDFSSLAKQISFPSAPLWFVCLFFAVAAFVGACGGISALSRIHKRFVPLIVAGLVLLIVSVIWTGNPIRLTPILGNGIDSVLSGSLSGTIMYADVFIFFLLLPEDKEKAFSCRKIVSFASIGIALTALFVFALNLVISSQTVSSSEFPFYLAIKEVHYGRFFQRIDAVMLFVSSLSGMLYLALNTAAFAALAERILKTGQSKLLAACYVFFLIIFALLSRALDAKFFTFLYYVLGFSGVALVLLIMLFAARRKSNEKA